MFTSQPIGFVSSPYKDTKEIPKGLNAKHDAEGVLKILPEFEPGLTDIEGFSHLFVRCEQQLLHRRQRAGQPQERQAQGQRHQHDAHAENEEEKAQVVNTPGSPLAKP